MHSISDGASGVNIQITACGLDGDTAWLFDFDPNVNGGTYTLDLINLPVVPVASTDGTFAFTDKPIGNPGDIDAVQVLELVDASPSCTYALLHKKPDQNGNIQMTSLPGGCAVAGKRDVKVSYPR
jgi:hypothetical protein